MRNPRDQKFAKYRHFQSPPPHDEGGCFLIERPEGNLLIIASSGMEWDHVSVSLEDRCPTWEEMELVKRMFFYPDEVCYQLHVAEEEHISCMPNCLHIWRPQNEKIPIPPPILVGPKSKPLHK